MNTLKIKGFKCFKNERTFNLKSLTAFTGSNGTGKSSVIQAILLSRLSIITNLYTSNGSDYQSDTWSGYPTPLNSGFELNLGTAYDIINRGTQNLDIDISFDEENYKFNVDKLDSTSVNCIHIPEKTQNTNIPFWRKKEFYYLNTERDGPRLYSPINYTYFTHVGYKGEFTAQVMLKNDFMKILPQKQFRGTKSEYLLQQIDAWIDYICPNTSVKAIPLGNNGAQIRIRSKHLNDDLLAPNIGFGISYALPIIVNGLVATPGSAFIVENPEAHLHPKGQSNMGYFLGQMAAAGLNVIIETHSEHIINGIRRATLSNLGLNNTDVALYFFSSEEPEKSNLINIELNGDLSDFPLDFFDQIQQDLFEIRNLSNQKENQHYGESTT